MSQAFLNDLLPAAFTFSSRPVSLPPDQRLSWRLPLLLLTLDASRGGKSSFRRLAVMAYALNTQRGQTELENALTGAKLNDLPIRFEPGFPFLLTFAVASRFVDQKKRSYHLTNKGKQLAQTCRDLDTFSRQSLFLKTFGKLLTETLAERILTSGLTYVD